MKLGIVGTSYISYEFAHAAALAGFEVGVVMSRDKERGEKLLSRFARSGKSSVYSSIEEMASDVKLDVVYIASPNALHYPQSIAAITGGKHVIVEKPCYMTLGELDNILALAKQKSVCVLEALRSFYSPAIDCVREAMAHIRPIRHVYFNRMRYSSRYDEYKAGITNSSFSKELGGGALSDLGVYLVYAAMDLFGMPMSLSYRSQYLESGVDSVTGIVMGYEGFNCMLAASKVSNSFIDSEIQGENGSILIKTPFLHSEIVLRNNNGVSKEVINCKSINDMQVQAKALFRIITDRDIGSLTRAHQFMRNSTAILDACRKGEGGYVDSISWR